MIRLEKELSAENIDQLNESFADIVASGKIEKSEARRQEKDEPDLMSKPRLSFRNNKQSPARLNEMILAINEVGRRAIGCRQDYA